MRPSRLRPDLRGPVTSVAITGHKRPAPQMLEGGAIALGEEEILFPVRDRPIERQGDLVHGSFA